MSTPYYGEIRMFGGTFAIRGFAACDGQSLPIAQNDVLYAVLGTTYGGDGVNNFNLPDLRGRLPVHQGTLQGGPTFTLGQPAGTETVTLITGQLPIHTHAPAAGGPVSATSPAGALLGVTASGNELYAAAGSGTVVQMAPGAVGPAGSSQPHDNMMPYLPLTFLISLNGLFPSRN